MLIKPPDDKQPQLAVLQSLLIHPEAAPASRQRIEQEIRNIRAGVRGEAEAAYEMSVHFPGANYAVIHDLRIEYAGLVAQIDHLVINRWLDIWVCESKNFSEGVAINEHGEFAAFFNHKPYGVPSPIEQNNRHLLILQRMLASGAVKLPTRLGFTLKPTLHSLILVSKGARISRPKVKIDGLAAVIKNDSLATSIFHTTEAHGAISMAKVVGCDTLESFARDLVKLHSPIEFNWHAKFGLSAHTATAIPQAAATAAPVPELVPTLAPDLPEPADGEKPRQKLVCFKCSSAVPYNVARFCWHNKSRFGGNLYCVGCQKLS